MCDEIDHPSRPVSLRRLPVALCGLLNLPRELQEHLALVIDEERESTADTDNQTEDKRAHSLVPPGIRIIFKFVQLNLAEKTPLKCGSRSHLLSAIVPLPAREGVRFLTTLRNAATF